MKVSLSLFRKRINGRDLKKLHLRDQKRLLENYEWLCNRDFNARLSLYDVFVSCKKAHFTLHSKKVDFTFSYWVVQEYEIIHIIGGGDPNSTIFYPHIPLVDIHTYTYGYAGGQEFNHTKIAMNFKKSDLSL